MDQTYNMIREEWGNYTVAIGYLPPGFDLCWSDARQPGITHLTQCKAEEAGERAGRKPHICQLCKPMRRYYYTFATCAMSDLSREYLRLRFLTRANVSRCDFTALSECGSRAAQHFKHQKVP
jgi:hypothetical protein